MLKERVQTLHSYDREAAVLAGLVPCFGLELSFVAQLQP
jgi:hypothetical protein